MKKDHFPHANKLDASITELIQSVKQRGDAAGEPEMRMTDDIRRAYQAEADEDARSLERVLARLVREGAQEQQKVISPPRIYQKQERMSSMQPNTTDSFTVSVEQRAKGRLLRRVGALAAVLCLLALVGGFLTILNSFHTKPANSNVASHSTGTPTPQPSPTIVALRSGPLGTIAFEGAAYNTPISWSPTGNRVAGVDASGVPASWDGLTGGNVVRYPISLATGRDAYVGGVAWSPDGNRIAFLYGQGITIVDAHSGTELKSWLAQSQYNFQTLSWSPNGKYLATTTGKISAPAGQSDDNHLIVYDLASGQKVVEQASRFYNKLAWSPNGKYLAGGNVSEAGGQASAYDLWNSATWTAYTFASVADLSWSPDGSQIALIRGGSVQIVDAASKNIVRSFAGGSGSLATIAWQPHGTRILVRIDNLGAQTSYLSLWDTQTGKHVYTFKTYQGAFNDNSAWSSDGKYVLMSAFKNIQRGTWYEVLWIAE
jgi:WD40 repeat protein